MTPADASVKSLEVSFIEFFGFDEPVDFAIDDAGGDGVAFDVVLALVAGAEFVNEHGFHVFAVLELLQLLAPRLAHLFGRCRHPFYFIRMMENSEVNRESLSSTASSFSIQPSPPGHNPFEDVKDAILELPE